MHTKHNFSFQALLLPDSGINSVRRRASGYSLRKRAFAALAAASVESVQPFARVMISTLIPRPAASAMRSCSASEASSRPIWFSSLCAKIPMLTRMFKTMSGIRVASPSGER